MVTWEVHRSDGLGNDIYARHISTNGNADGSSFRITTTPGNVSNPVVEMTESGDFVVAWELDGPSGSDIMARRFDASGNPKGAEFRVNDVVGGVCDNPSIASTAGNGFVVEMGLRSPAKLG